MILTDNLFRNFSGKALTAFSFTQMTSKSSLKEVAVLRGHLSNIRCLTVLPLPQENGGLQPTGEKEEMEKALLVSGGGRAELRLWLLAIHNGMLTIVFFSRISQTNRRIKLNVR